MKTLGTAKTRQEAWTRSRVQTVADGISLALGALDELVTVSSYGPIVGPDAETWERLAAMLAEAQEHVRQTGILPAEEE